MTDMQSRLVNSAAAWIAAAPRREDRQARRAEVLRDFDAWTSDHLANPAPGERVEFWNTVIYLNGLPSLGAKVDRAMRGAPRAGRRTTGWEQSQWLKWAR